MHRTTDKYINKQAKNIIRYNRGSKYSAALVSRAKFSVNHRKLVRGERRLPLKSVICLSCLSITRPGSARSSVMTRIVVHHKQN